MTIADPSSTAAPRVFGWPALACRLVDAAFDTERDAERAARAHAARALLPCAWRDAFDADGSAAWRQLEPPSMGESASEQIQLEVALIDLAQARALEFADDVAAPTALLRPIADGFMPDWRALPPSPRLRLSRFAYLRREPGGGADGADALVLECPLGLARVTLLAPAAALAVHTLAIGLGVADTVSPALLRLLWLARCLDDIDDPTGEARQPALQQWEFHDLLFHMRSRIGRHDQPMGAQFRFKGVLPPQPSLKPGYPGGAPPITLNRPDLVAVTARDPRFTEVLESRRSRRTHGPGVISATELGEFLFRVARVRGRTITEAGELTNRPYPNGGASYELELYLTIAACDGLAPGFYHYDPEAHTLRRLHEPNAHTAALLRGAYQSCAGSGVPQVLVTLASRFQRVAWKYSGIAYATQLKNTGALLCVMYLVATAMGLAPCALGLGDIERFRLLVGSSPFEEGSIGEFMLGRAG